MFRCSRFVGVLLVATVAVAAFSGPVSTRAGLGDKIKKKAEKKATDTANQKVDQATDKAPASDPAAEEAPAGEPGSAPPPAEVSAVSTKFDFVPGEKVILFDDFTSDELGEFPAHWRLVQGTVETAEMKGERWCRLAGDFAYIRPKLEPMTGLPENWTLEFDTYTTPPYQMAFAVCGMAGNQAAWIASLLQYSGTTVTFQSGSIQAQTVFEQAADMGGRRHVSILARGAALKVYVDTQRMLNIPEVSAQYGTIDAIQVEFRAPGPRPMITNVRFAEGPKPPKDLLAETFVTYGIYFESGSDVVKPESAPVLRQIASYMEKNATVRVNITGHTDSQGTPAGNLDLSKRRAASVAHVLSEEFGIAADRFTTDGSGDTKAIADNADAAGRAMNRRVEFTRI